MALNKKPVNGMKDILPEEMQIRDYVMGVIKENYRKFGFTPIETPCVESIGNLCSKQGGENEKLIFKILKRGEKLNLETAKEENDLVDSGLRYDLTLPLSRYYANHANELPNPFKALQMGNVWRADRPQKGRFRQFMQCDIDILGEPSNLAEIELITATATMLSKILAEANLNAFTIHINDRRMLAAAALTAGFEQEEIGGALISLDKFDKIGMNGIEKDLLESGYAPEKVEKYMAFYRSVRPGMEIADFCAGVNGEYLEARVGETLADIVGCVQPMLGEGVKIVFDPTLVRGMGYYTGPIFEVTLDGYNFAIAGGGRYDQMIGKFSGQNVSACGFSIGFERIVTILKDHEQGSFKLPEGSVAYLIGNKVPTARKAEVLAQAAEARKAGVVATVLPMSKNMKHQIELLEAEGFTKFEKIYE